MTTRSRWKPNQAGAVVIPLEKRDEHRVTDLLHQAAIAHAEFEVLPNWRFRSRFDCLRRYHDLHQEAKAIARGGV